MRTVAGSVRTIRVRLRCLEIAIVKALVCGEKADGFIKRFEMRCLEVMVEIDQVAIQAGNWKMAHAWQSENPVLRIIEALGNYPDGCFDLREIDRRFDICEQEQGPKRGSEHG